MFVVYVMRDLLYKLFSANFVKVDFKSKIFLNFFLDILVLIFEISQLVGKMVWLSVLFFINIGNLTQQKMSILLDFSVQ